MITEAELTVILDRLTAKQRTIQQNPPLHPASVDSLLDDFALRQAHATTAIEGNTLTLAQTQAVLEQGITIPGKSLREHLEVVNAHATWQWLRPLAQQRQPLTKAMILEIHRRLMQGIFGDEAGLYRRAPVYIRGAWHVPPNWVKVPQLVEDWIAQYSAGPGDEHLVRLAARAHIDLVDIHPFLDGNGRTTRMVVNVLLMQANYPPALYAVEDRDQYIQALRQADLTQDITSFVAVTAKAVEFTLDRWLGLIQQVQEANAQREYPPITHPDA